MCQHRQKKKQTNKQSKNKHANKQHKTKKTASNITHKHQEPSIILNHAAGFCWHGRGIDRKVKVRMKEGITSFSLRQSRDSNGHLGVSSGDSTAWFCLAPLSLLLYIIYIGTWSKVPLHWVSSAMKGVTNDSRGKYISEFSWKAVIIILNFRNFI